MVNGRGSAVGGPTRVALVYGAPTPPKRLGALCDAARDHLQRHPDVAAPLVDLSEEREAREDDLALVAASDATLLFSPVYRASVPAVLKAFLEDLDPQALTAKPVGVVSMGYSDGHQLAIPAAVAPILEWFGAIAVPGPLYVTDADFADGRPSSAARDLVAAFADLTLFLATQVRGCPTPAAVGPSLR